MVIQNVALIHKNGNIMSNNSCLLAEITYIQGRTEKVVRGGASEGGEN